MVGKLRLVAVIVLFGVLGCAVSLRAQVEQPKNIPPTESLPPQVQQQAQLTQREISARESK